MDRLGRRGFIAGAGLLAAVGCRPRRDPYAIEKPPLPVAPGVRAGGETHVLSTCGLCRAGCGIRVRTVEGRAVKIEGNPDSPVGGGRLCARGQAAIEVLYHPNRVRGPMRRIGGRGDNRWQPLSWDQAVGELGAELSKLRAAGEPQSLVLLDGEYRGATHALWTRLLEAFGSPNHLGHGATGPGGLLRAVRRMAGASGLPGYDFGNARRVLLVGTGALESSPQAIFLARALAGGTRPRILCAWPRLPPTAVLVDDWLPLMPGSQATFLLALVNVLIREGLGDESGLQDARGFQPFIDAEGATQPGLRGRVVADFAPDKVEARVGIPARRMIELARELAADRPSLVVVDEDGSDEPAASVGLLLNAMLSGLDVPGGMLLDGGDGFAALVSPARDDVAEKGLAMVAIDGRDPSQRAFEDARILDVPGAVLSGKPYPAKILLLHYSNPAYAKPGARRWKEALAKVPFVVSFSPLQDESALFADLLLPDASFLERWDVIALGRGSRALSLRQPAVRPRFDSMQTGEVILRLARAVGGAVAEAMPWRSYREVIETMLARVEGGELEALAEMESKGVWVAPAAEDLPVPDGGAGQRPRPRLRDVTLAMPPELPPVAGDPARFPFVLLPFRGPGYAEGGMRHMPRLRELPLVDGDPWEEHIEISARDAGALHIEDGDKVVVETLSARVELRAKVSHGLRPSVLGLPLGGGEPPAVVARPAVVDLLSVLTDERTGQWFACATRARLRRGA